MTSIRRTLCTAGCLLALIAVLRVPARAQANLYALQAAYIFNFTEFADWPVAPAHGPNLVVCANQHSALGTALSKLDGRLVAGKAWRLRPVPEAVGVTACNVLVIDESTAGAPSTKAVLASDAPLLVVRTAEAGDGPYVILLFRDGDKLRFDIDKSEATRRHITLSSKLLRLARSVL
ncbi:YfiR family protein [Trinickia fusca]|uniref:YfiR family protein n=1 Tax=Trinickia fusca TaxID=2419777 RepID=A0A494X4F0_9BURK|nr:YfiR family protein [Trinickia fusca]RKP44541.1 YfiR family protein [Trinickia fusca]